MKYIIFGVILFLSVGCIGGKVAPECNAKYPASKLTDIANEKGVCLSDVGSGLIIANGAAISLAKLYTAQQALDAVDGWIEVLGQAGLTDVVFHALVKNRISEFPELMILTDVFAAKFQTGEVLDQGSKQILVDYLKQRVRAVLLTRVNASK